MFLRSSASICVFENVFSFCLADNIGVTQKRKSVKLIDVDTMCKEGDFVEPCGSKGYAAPEVIKASEENKKIQADTSFDVFSFGKTIRNLLPNTESQNLLFQSLNSIVKLSTKVTRCHVNRRHINYFSLHNFV